MYTKFDIVFIAKGIIEQKYSTTFLQLGTHITTTSLILLAKEKRYFFITGYTSCCIYHLITEFHPQKNNKAREISFVPIMSFKNKNNGICK